MRIPVIISSVLVALALVAAGCSSDGGDGTSPFGPGDDNAADLGDIDFEDLANGDLDLGDIDLGDIDLEDLANGDLDFGDIDLEDLTSGDLEDAIGTAEDFLDQFGGDGGGTVEFAGDTIEFEAEFCFAFDGDLDVSGPGTAADGTPVWVSISHTVDTRAELVEFIGEDTVDLIYGDADPIITDIFSLDYGREEMFGSVSNELPAIYADSSILNTEIEMDVSGGSATGSGMAADGNYVLGDFDATFPFSFQASCS